MESKLLGKIEITGIIELLTGMHIGRSKDTLQIGGIDSIIVRDPFTNEPYIPGSSLKGKMRSLAEKILLCHNNPLYGLDYVSKIGGGNSLYKHECPTSEMAVTCPVCRLFGTAGNADTLSNYKQRYDKRSKEHQAKQNKQEQFPESPVLEEVTPTNFPARVTVWDAFLTEDSKNKYRNMSDLPYAEWKSENTLDRITATANPRQIERAARGLTFDFTLMYSIKPDGQTCSDIQNLLYALWLTEETGLGGQISRGYGRIKIKNLQLSKISYNITDENGIKKFSHQKDIVKKNIDIQKVDSKTFETELNQDKK